MPASKIKMKVAEEKTANEDDEITAEDEDDDFRSGLKVALRFYKILRKLQTATSANRLTVDVIWRSCFDVRDDYQEVSKRTVQEYLKVLVANDWTGVRRSGDQRKGGFKYIWEPEVEDDRNILTPESALALCLVEAHLKHILPEKEQRRLKRLFGHAADVLKRENQNNKYQDLLRRIEVVPRGFSMIAPKTDVLILERVMQAVMEGKRLKVEYKGRKDKGPKERCLEPVGIVERSGVFYLIAREQGEKRDSGDYKSWAVHRIQRAETDIRFTYPKPEFFNLKEHVRTGYLGGVFSKKPVKVKLRFTGDSGRHLGAGESRLSESHKVVADNDTHTIIECEIHDSVEFRRWILERGATCEVLEPAELREAVRGELEGALKHYRSKA